MGDVASMQAVVAGYDSLRGEVGQEHLLSSIQMAQFVTDGYLLFPGFVPDELNKAVHKDQEAFSGDGFDFWFRSEAIRAVFEHPPVKGILQSLVGPNPRYDHSFLHTVPPKKQEAQTWHQDAIVDPRPLEFDVQAFYFAHDTPKEMGPTLILPGSHLRRVSYLSIGRYKNILGQTWMEGPAGTIAFALHGIWHCAQPNRTDRTRTMFKLRLNPTVPQRGLFDMFGYDELEVRRHLMNKGFRWHGDDDRAESINRIRLWRYLTGDDSIPTEYTGIYSWDRE